MRLAILLLLAALPDDERALRFFARIKFEKVEPRDDEGRRVMDLLLKKPRIANPIKMIVEIQK